MLHQLSADTISKSPPPARDQDAQAFLAAIQRIGIPLEFHKGAEIYGEHEPAEYLYKLTSGSVRTYKLLDDGRRQIGAFYLPGDIFGLETDDTHGFFAEAIVDSKVVAIKRSELISLAAREPRVARHLWTLTAAELQRVQEHIIVFVMTARERVAGFLLEMAQRSAAALDIDLPMPRQDIADYLGLTVETVSRTLTNLENATAITRPNAHRVVLRDSNALRRFNA